MRSWLRASPDEWEHRVGMTMMYVGLAAYAPLWVTAIVFWGAIILGFVAYVVACVAQERAKERAKRPWR